LRFFDAEYPNKRKKLTHKSKVKNGIQRLELHCKDFRIIAFNFKFTVKGEEKGVSGRLLLVDYSSRTYCFTVHSI